MLPVPNTVERYFSLAGTKRYFTTHSNNSLSAPRTLRHLTEHPLFQNLAIPCRSQLSPVGSKSRVTMHLFGAAARSSTKREKRQQLITQDYDDEETDTKTYDATTTCASRCLLLGSRWIRVTFLQDLQGRWNDRESGWFSDQFQWPVYQLCRS
jgi:hypothetical protein